MRIIQPHELKAVLGGDTAVAFLSDTYWEPLPMYAEELEPLKVSFLLFKKGETVHNDSQVWAVHATTGWLLHAQTELLAQMANLPKRTISPKIGGVIEVATAPNPHTRPALLMGLTPVINWVIAHRGGWVRNAYEVGYVDIDTVAWGDTLKSKAIVFSTGDALLFSPQGGRRPYTLSIYPPSPKLY